MSLHATLSLDMHRPAGGTPVTNRMMHFLDWFLIGWAVISAIATPFVGRLVSDRLSDVAAATTQAPAPLIPVRPAQPGGRQDAP